MARQMKTKAQAHALLDELKAGRSFAIQTIRHALRLTGDKPKTRFKNHLYSWGYMQGRNGEGANG